MISKSDKRHTFQFEKYLDRCKEKGEEPNKDYVDYFQNIIDTYDERFNNQDINNNLEYDLLTNFWILEKVRNSDIYAQNLYAAICNNEFVKNDVWPLLEDDRQSYSWRYAGGIIADMQQKGDYINWYCSGIGSEDNGYVGESVVTDEIRQDLLKLGWVVIEDDK